LHHHINWEIDAARRHKLVKKMKRRELEHRGDPKIWPEGTKDATKGGKRTTSPGMTRKEVVLTKGVSRSSQNRSEGELKPLSIQEHGESGREDTILRTGKKKWKVKGVKEENKDLTQVLETNWKELTE